MSRRKGGNMGANPGSKEMSPHATYFMTKYHFFTSNS